MDPDGALEHMIATAAPLVGWGDDDLSADYAGPESCAVHEGAALPCVACAVATGVVVLAIRARAERWCAAGYADRVMVGAEDPARREWRRAYDRGDERGPDVCDVCGGSLRQHTRDLARWGRDRPAESLFADL